MQTSREEKEAGLHSTQKWISIAISTLRSGIASPLSIKRKSDCRSPPVAQLTSLVARISEFLAGRRTATGVINNRRRSAIVAIKPDSRYAYLTLLTLLTLLYLPYLPYLTRAFSWSRYQIEPLKRKETSNRSPDNKRRRSAVVAIQSDSR